MRNLKSVHRALLKNSEGLRLTASAWDVALDSIICTFGPNKDNILLQLKRWNESSGLENIASWDAPCPLPEFECDQILDLYYFSDTLTTCIILAGGDLIVVREEPQLGEEKIEIVGSVDAGISAAAWSPDGELLAITTRAGTLLYMTRDFENAIDVTFVSEDLKASNHVSVGWGKSETQFKGRGAKALQDPTMPERVDEGVLSKHDSKTTTISWRGDGSYVAINSVEPGSRRVIRVYSREGSLDSVSEPVDGLEGALSWRPAGNLMAGIQRLQDRIDVVFFERNGLRHGKFPLRLTQDEMETWATEPFLKWNTDSSVLAVCFKDRVQLWTMGNYHYYLKQEIFSRSRASTKLCWHPEKALRFAVSSDEGIEKLEYNFGVASGPTSPPNDYGIVAVIDGRNLKLTPLRHANIPPPMALHEIALKDNALDVTVTIADSKEPLALISVLFHSSVSLYQWQVTAKPSKPPTLRWDRELSSEMMNHYGLVESSVALSSVGIEDSKDSDNQVVDVSFRVSNNGSLYADQRLLSKNCTSFLVTPAHLILTTGQHLLKFVHMAPVEDMEVPPDTPESDERCRSIERGAKLVTVMPSIFALVMQMPRGNLETIYPRALVLAGIRQSINDREYKKAFLACRNQRVDMNILHDHTPENFIANDGSFVDQVQKVEHIDLFLSQLREEDVSTTMYRETLQVVPVENRITEPETSKGGNLSKINKICDAFLEVLQSRGPAHIQNVITAHVCKSPPDLDAGLIEISKIRRQQPDHVDRAVEHICFLADVNRLHDNALGLYDLDLTLLVAQQSQKDPREYLPFLQNLQGMSPLRRQYSIDNHLSRYKKALKHLCDLDAFDEVKAYTVKHELYQDALEWYRYREDNLRAIMRLYADHLHRISQFREAGIAYEYLLDHPSALESYRLAHLWRESLSSATLIPLPPTQLHSLALTLADGLTESKVYSAAATIHIDYLSDIPTAARLLCKGYFFPDAQRLLALHNRTNLLTEILDAGLADGMATMTELLADCKAQLLAQVPRIRDLRKKKADDPLAFFEGSSTANAGDPDIPDNISLASTSASTMATTLVTRYTSHSTAHTSTTHNTRNTSRHRRREERKRARGKKGSVYEEEYLVNSIGRLIERVNSVGDEVGRLVTALVRRGMRERARAVEAGMVEVVEMCRGCLGEVFGGEGVDGGKGEVGGNGGEGERPMRGGDAVLWDSLEGVQGSARTIPVVREFKTLSLLGL